MQKTQVYTVATVDTVCRGRCRFEEEIAVLPVYRVGTAITTWPPVFRDKESAEAFRLDCHDVESLRVIELLVE